MDTCTVEVGLLKKHPCGGNAVAKCGNCEQPICTKHAAGQMSGGKKIFLCPECNRAWKESEKLGEIPSTPAASPVAPPPAPGAKKPEPPKPAAKPAAKPAEKKPEPAEEHSGALEFSPGKPAEPKPQPAPAPAAKKPEPPKPGKTELSLEDSAPPEPDKK